MKVTVDREVCIGAASCVGIAPGVFELDDQFKSVVKGTEGADPQALRQAAAACPVGAITVEESEEGLGAG